MRRSFGGLVLAMLAAQPVLADSWALPSVRTNRAENGLFEEVIKPDGVRARLPSLKGPTATLMQKAGETWTNLWEAKLVNQEAPVSAMVADSGRYVVTFDEWHSVGEKPVVIYGQAGRLVAELSLADLRLQNHPNISRSISSYHWNEHAINLFGPSADQAREPWQKTLEDSLFIRLYWGEVIAIDLAGGKVRDAQWLEAYPKDQRDKLIKATTEYLEAKWRRLAGDYLRKANFEPDPKSDGVTGVLLAGQLHLREALPLLKEIAATDRFKHWAAPGWKTADNLQELAQKAITEIEATTKAPAGEQTSKAAGASLLYTEPPRGDPRLQALARQLVQYSISLKSGEKVLIEGSVNARPLVKALVQEVYRAGGIPFVQLTDPSVERTLAMGATEQQMQLKTQWDSVRARAMDAWLFIEDVQQKMESADVPVDTLQMQQRNNNRGGGILMAKRWCVLGYPTAAAAQAANLSTDAFEDFCFQAASLDYAKLKAAMAPLAELLRKTDRVRLVGPGTDLAFSIKDIRVMPCAGEHNLPDGEIFTAPVRESVNGVVSFNVPTVFAGSTLENIKLEFKDGRVVKAEANDTGKLNRLLKTDAGASYVGEFALGLNPLITRPVKNVLYDEKISGSFHLALGNAYSYADNRNHSLIHQDLVCIQTPEQGGGEVWFDERLIRKDGRFIPPELHGLNPENLKP